jgi:NAD(P)-dependent dehydrogenase (short-subunit alcohol dehydrogenase family)
MVTVNQYFEIESAYEEAVTAASDGIGGRHALLVAVLRRAGIVVASSREAELAAEKVIREGWAEVEIFERMFKERMDHTDETRLKFIPRDAGGCGG